MSILADLIEANAAMTAAYADRSGTLAAFRKQNEASERVNQLTDLAAEEFATLNSWKIAKSPFNPDCIGRKRNVISNRYTPVQSWMDHTTYFRTPGSTAAGIVGQPYGTLDQYRDELDGIAQRCELKWSVPPNERISFWYPGKCLFIVLTKPEHQIIWFLEQQEFSAGVDVTGDRGEGSQNRSSNAA